MEQLDARIGIVSKHIRKAGSWRVVPTLLSAAARRTWRADRGGGRNVDAGGRGRAMSVLACSKSAIRAVGLDGRRRGRGAACTFSPKATRGLVRLARSREREGTRHFGVRVFSSQQIRAIRGFHRLAPVLYIFGTQLRAPPHQLWRAKAGVRGGYHVPSQYIHSHLRAE